MSRWIGSTALALLLACPLAASANFRSWFGAPAVTTRYYTVPVVCVPTPRVVTPVAVAVPLPIAAPLPPLAVPVPAAPSTTREPPLAVPTAKPPAPAVSAGNDAGYFDTYPAATVAGQAAGDRCSIAFWNLSARDLTLKVAGQTRVLPRGKSVTVELGREFAWQLDGRDTQTQRVPAGEAALEIVIRR